MGKLKLSNIIIGVVICAVLLVQSACTTASGYESSEATGEQAPVFSASPTASTKVLLDTEQQEDGAAVYQQAEETGSGDIAAEGDEEEGSSGDVGVLALWINGERVVQTPEQVAAWERGLYACQSEEEYNEYLKNVAYYKKGVDMSRFEWAWDDMRDIYTDEQIALLKEDSNAKKRMPNAIGMTAQQAYTMFTDAGFIVRIVYAYDANTDVPAGRCYEQEIPAGQMHRLGTSFFIWIQKARSEVRLTVPNVLYQPEATVRQWLSNMGFANVRYQYEYSDNASGAGYCIAQSLAAGTTAGMDDYLLITISLGPAPSPPSEEPSVTPSEDPSAPPSEEPSVVPSVIPESTPLP